MKEIFGKHNIKIQFTLEMEKNKFLSFLDVLVHNNNGQIETNWYRKKTYSGRVLHFLSNHPITQKKAMVYNLVDKAILLSDSSFHQNNLDFVKKTLLSNAYPLKFIKKFMKLRLEKLKHNTPNRSRSTDEKFIVLPYIKNFPKQFEEGLKSLDFKPVYKINNKLKDIVKKRQR